MITATWILFAGFVLSIGANFVFFALYRIAKENADIFSDKVAGLEREKAVILENVKAASGVIDDDNAIAWLQNNTSN